MNKARKESGAVDQFLRVVRETTCPDVLTPELVGNLIDRVEVGETYMEGDLKKRFFTETWGIDRKRVEKRSMKD